MPLMVPTVWIAVLTQDQVQISHIVTEMCVDHIKISLKMDIVPSALLEHRQACQVWAASLPTLLQPLADQERESQMMEPTAPCALITPELNKATQFALQTTA
jgi:hypothetical protein